MQRHEIDCLGAAPLGRARPKRTGMALGALLAALTLGPRLGAGAEPTAPSGAQPSEAEKAAARQLFGQGKALESKAEWGEALETFEKVANVIMTPQVRYHLALCHANLGHMVEAINGFELAIQEAKVAGDKAKDVTENAPKRLEELRERVGYVRVNVVGKIRSSQILIDGRPLARALLDADIPLNPGAHTLEVEGGGASAQKRELQIEKQTTAEVELQIDDQEPASKPAQGSPDGPSTTLVPAADTDSRVAAYVVGAAGLALLAGGGVFWGLRESTISEIRNTCNGSDEGCDPGLKDKADLGKTYTTVGRVLFPVGGTALAAAVVLWFVLAPPEDDSSAPSESALRVLPTPSGIQVFGTF